MGDSFYFIIKGNVQGVSFRHHTKRLAALLGLRGYVKNLPDGTVEICVQENEKGARELLQRLQKLPFPIQITSILESKLPSRENYDSFSILKD